MRKVFFPLLLIGLSTGCHPIDCSDRVDGGGWGFGRGGIYYCNDKTPQSENKPKKPTPKYPSPYEEAAMSWEGHNIDELLDSWTDPPTNRRSGYPCPSSICSDSPSYVTKVYSWSLPYCNTKFGVYDTGKIVWIRLNSEGLLEDLLTWGDCDSLIRSGKWSPKIAPGWYDEDKKRK